jgi:hypothetical protein
MKAPYVYAMDDGCLSHHLRCFSYIRHTPCPTGTRDKLGILKSRVSFVCRTKCLRKPRVSGDLTTRCYYCVFPTAWSTSSTSALPVSKLRNGPASDRRVLRNWRAACPQLLWDESRPVTEWERVSFGVEGTDAGRVVKLDLGLMRLNYNKFPYNKFNYNKCVVPAELGRLTALRDLRLNGNKFTSVPAELGRLTALTRLDLRTNDLKSVPGRAVQVDPRLTPG